jgi:dTMP kinase
VRAANAAATGGLSPDLTVLVEVPAAVADARQAERVADRIERAGRAFHERVAAAYRSLRRTEPGVEAVDGTADTETVHFAVLQLLRRRFPETFAVEMVK